MVICNLDGKVVRAFLPNPGRLWELLLPGVAIYLEEAFREERKLPFTAVAVERDGYPVMLHTHTNNDVARHLIERGLIPGLKGAAIITPNHLEAEQMSGIKITDGKSLKAAGEKLLTELDSKAILITRGESGMSIFERDKPMITIPTVAREVFDVTGAGDTVIAALALGLAAKLSFAQAAALANYAAGITVGKVGTSTVTVEEIKKTLEDEQSNFS